MTPAGPGHRQLEPADLGRRIAVIGGSGSGKTTLARRLAERLGVAAP